MIDFTATHPQYDARLTDWQKLADICESEAHVKGCGKKYLPYTASQLEDGADKNAANSDGEKAYEAYKARARFHCFTRRAMTTILGFMHRKAPTIKLPKKMQPLEERATIYGETLRSLLASVNMHQLKYGRVGLLADMPEGESRGVLPYIALYTAQSIRNWNVVLAKDGRLRAGAIVLDESGPTMSEMMQWTQTDQKRLVRALNGKPYEQIVCRNNVIGEQPIIPKFEGSVLTEIPFVFINTMDTSPDVDVPPLLSLADLDIGIYMAEADYREALHKQGQDTLVTIGLGEVLDPETGQKVPIRIGSRGHIDIPAGGDAKFIGVSSGGLPAQEKALATDKADAATYAGKLLDSKAAESGDALNARITANTTSAVTIVNTGAAGVERILRVIAGWMGEKPEEVTVEPNRDFVNDAQKAAEVLAMVEAKLAGATISFRTIHRAMQKMDMTDLTFEQEIETMLEEAQDAPPGSEGRPDPRAQRIQDPGAEPGASSGQ